MRKILDTKLKFYFALMFISKNDFNELIKNIDNNLMVTDTALMNKILDDIEKIEENININDNVISRIFDPDYLIKQKDLYIQKNGFLDLEDEENKYDFLCFSMLNKVKGIKQIYKCTLYDFFVPYKKEEVNRAIANLDGYETEQLTMYFGINYDRLVDINTSDININSLLIKIYYYLLNNSDDNDVDVLFKLYDNSIKEEYNLYDYIRFLYDDKSLTDPQILKIINKLDYDTKLNLKLTFGKDFKDKKKVDLNKNVKKSISKLTSKIKKENVVKKDKLVKDDKKLKNKKVKLVKPKIVKTGKKKKGLVKDDKKLNNKEVKLVKKDIIKKVKKKPVIKNKLVKDNKKLDTKKIKLVKKEPIKKVRKKTGIDKKLVKDDKKLNNKKVKLVKKDVVKKVPKKQKEVIDKKKINVVKKPDKKVKLEPKDKNIKPKVNEIKKKPGVAVVEPKKEAEKKNIKLAPKKEQLKPKKVVDKKKIKKNIGVKEKQEEQKKKKEGKSEEQLKKEKEKRQEELKKQVEQKKKLEEEKRKQQEKDQQRKKVGISEEELKKEKQKKEQEKRKEEKKKQEEELKKKPKEDKKTRIDRFLSEYNLDKKDFLLAVALLSPLSKEIVELYYGLKKDPIDMEEISLKIGRELDASWNLLDEANKKIVDLIKYGEIHKNKEDKKQEEQKKKLEEEKKKQESKKELVTDNRLKTYVSEKNIEKDKLFNVVNNLSGVSSVVVSMYLGINTKERTVSEIAHDLNYKEESVSEIINDATYVVIDELSKLEKEVKPVIEEKTPEELEEEQKKKEQEEQEKRLKEQEEKEKEEKLDDKYLDTGDLPQFLINNKMTREEFSYSYKKLDSMSKRIISLYFSSYTINDIAKEYDMDKDDILDIVSNSKDKIIKEVNELKKEKSNMTLAKYLAENNITFLDFKRHFPSLTTLQQTVLNMYLGLNGAALTEKEIAEKLFRSEDSIKNIIKDATVYLKELSSKKDQKEEKRLERFLRENNMTVEQLNEAMQQLDPLNAKVMALYFTDKSMGDISKSVGMTRLQVITIISASKKELVRLAKTPRRKDRRNDNSLSSRARNILRLLVMYPALMAIMQTNPLAFQGISMLARTNLSIEDIARTLNVPPQILEAAMIGIITNAEAHVANMQQQQTSSFRDDGNSRDRNRSR